MNYNDNQQNTEHLLNWLNKERLWAGEGQRMYSFEQVKESRLLPLLLDKIHPSFFAEVIEKRFDHQGYFDRIERYLLEVEELRIRRCYRQLMMERGCVSDIVRLIFFVVMKHEGKHQFVDRVLELDEWTQVELMNELKKIQGYVQKTMEIREIFEKIQQLQEENQMLNEKIRELEKKNGTALQARQMLFQENQRLLKENRGNVKEKSYVLEELGVQQVKEYYLIFKDLENERVALIHSQKSIEAERNKFFEQNQQMEQKIAEDKQIVEYLNEQLLRYKYALDQFRPEYKVSNMRASKQNKQNFKNDYLSVGLISNAKMTKSAEHETTVCSSQYMPFCLEDEEPMTKSIKVYNQGLADKLHSMHARIQRLNEEIGSLKDEKAGLLRRNRKKERMIALVEREFRDFTQQYQLTMSV